MTSSKVCPEPSCYRIDCSIHTERARSTRSRSGSREQRLARFVLLRDKGMCYLCGQGGAQEADHVHELQHGGADHPSNMRAVHIDCHKAKTAANR